MIRNNILHPLFILALQVEFLKEEDPPNKSSLGILLGEKVLQSEWFVKITMSDPTKYARNLSKA